MRAPTGCRWTRRLDQPSGRVDRLLVGLDDGQGDDEADPRHDVRVTTALNPAAALGGRLGCPAYTYGEQSTLSMPNGTSPRPLSTTDMPASQ
jgi:hypothetical protein